MEEGWIIGLEGLDWEGSFGGRHLAFVRTRLEVAMPARWTCDGDHEAVPD